MSPLSLSLLLSFASLSLSLPSFLLSFTLRPLVPSFYCPPSVSSFIPPSFPFLPFLRFIPSFFAFLPFHILLFSCFFTFYLPSNHCIISVYINPSLVLSLFFPFSSPFLTLHLRLSAYHSVLNPYFSPISCPMSLFIIPIQPLSRHTFHSAPLPPLAPSLPPPSGITAVPRRRPVTLPETRNYDDNKEVCCLYS